MSRHPEFEELQDFQEGFLSPDRNGEIRAHLLECPNCREDLEALSELMADLGSLPVEAEPSRDLWPQIQWRISAAGPPVKNPARRSGITVPAWQLLAAGIALALMSGGTVWAIMSTAVQGPASVATEPAAIPSAPASVVPSTASSAEFAAYDGYADALADLEAVVETGRNVLDPETVRILEENLAIIDRAILESSEALAQDPGSRVLRRLLSRTMGRKVDLLQQAVEMIAAKT